MPNWSGAILTDKGRNLLAKVQQGRCKLVCTKMKLGSGTISGSQTLETLTDLVEPKQNLGINNLAYLPTGYCEISATVTNDGLETGYYVKEAGLFATDPDDGEILYAVTTDTAPDYLPAEGGATIVSEDFCMAIGYNNVSEISAVLNTNGLVTVAQAQSMHEKLLRICPVSEQPTMMDPDGIWVQIPEEE